MIDCLLTINVCRLGFNFVIQGIMRDDLDMALRAALAVDQNSVMIMSQFVG